MTVINKNFSLHDGNVYLSVTGMMSRFLNYKKVNDTVNFVNDTNFEKQKRNDSFAMSQELLSNISKLDKISRLEKNWNGYNADAFSKKLINKVKYIIMKLDLQPELFPVADNSIQLEYDIEDRYLEIQIYENDEAAIYETDADGKEKEYQIKCDLYKIKKLIEDFYG